MTTFSANAHKNKKEKHGTLPATAPATPHGLAKGGEVVPAAKGKKPHAAHPLAPRAEDRQAGFMNALFPKEHVSHGTRVKPGFAEGGEVKAPAAPNPLPKSLQQKAVEAPKSGVMGKLFPKMPRRGFAEGGAVEDPTDSMAAESGNVPATAPDADPKDVQGDTPVDNAAAEAIPQQDKGDLPAEVPGDNSDKVTTEGPFSDYLKQGVPADLVEKGNELAARLDSVTSGADPAAQDQFVADNKDFISELEGQVKKFQAQGGGEMLRALKSMLSDAKDLLASHDTITQESGMNDAAVQNNPEGVLAMGKKDEPVEEDRSGETPAESANQ